MFGDENLKIEHFDEAARLLAIGECAVSDATGLSFDMGEWESCFYGTAYLLATGKLARLSRGRAETNFEQLLGHLFLFTSLSDTYVAAIYRRLVERGEFDLSNMDLKYADFTDADLRLANLCGADVSNANLSFAAVRMCKYDDYTKFPIDFDPKDRDMTYVSTGEDQ